MISKLLRTILLTTCVSSQVFAADINIVGTINVNKPTQQVNKWSMLSHPDTQEIAILKLSLNDKAQQSIGNRLSRIQQSSSSNKHKSFQLPPKIQLGMNDVPVLNQGSHGSCVVFSVTAAMNAIIGKGDYVSQLCQLGLGRYLENNGYSSSGWNGSWGRTVLSEIDIFGFTSKESQRENGCAGLKEYPMNGEDLLDEESAQDFHKISQQLAKNHIAWTSILDVYQASADRVDEKQVLFEVKKAISSGDRVTLGMLLINFDQGTVGAIGTHNEKFDSWILTPEMVEGLNEQTEYAGHAILITGFDDNATATDEQGRAHKGLLTLRNSWGSNVGDKGDFYMSYSYFKGLVIEAQRIRHL
ncbi:MAG: C1 family peptidase [Legionellaceae bacterium]|nr:C1 family peptidase [Legionellaceae bacterium]